MFSSFFFIVAISTMSYSASADQVRLLDDSVEARQACVDLIRRAAQC